jgi:hypothetical protein
LVSGGQGGDEVTGQKDEVKGSIDIAGLAESIIEINIVSDPVIYDS